MICSFTRVPQAWVVTDADADTDVLRWSEWDDLARRSHCRVQRRESAAPGQLHHTIHHVTASAPPSFTQSPPRPYTAHTAPPWPHSRERRTCDAPTSVCDISTCAGPQLLYCLLLAACHSACSPIRTHAAGPRCASYQITCANLWRLQSCPTRNQPRTSRMLTCPVCDWTALRVWLPCTDAMLKAQWQARCPWLL